MPNIILQLFSSPFKDHLIVPKIKRIQLMQGSGVLRFHYNGSVPFKCDLECKRCVAITHAGVQCNKRTCKYQPYCPVHLRSSLGLVVKPSKLPNAGLGLFTLRDIPKKVIVCPYEGEEVNRKVINERYGNEEGDFAPYGIDGTATGKWGRDSACNRGVGSYANHAVESQANVRFASNQRSHSINLVSKKSIPAGSELLVNYGTQYFQKNMAEFKTR